VGCSPIPRRPVHTNPDGGTVAQNTESFGTASARMSVELGNHRRDAEIVASKRDRCPPTISECIQDNAMPPAVCPQPKLQHFSVNDWTAPPHTEQQTDNRALHKKIHLIRRTSATR